MNYIRSSGIRSSEVQTILSTDDNYLCCNVFAFVLTPALLKNKNNNPMSSRSKQTIV